MLAVEFRLPGSGEPDAQRVAAVVRHAQEQGLLLLTCGLYGNAIRFLYPLTIPQPLFARALDILDSAITQSASQPVAASIPIPATPSRTMRLSLPRPDL